jgi:hypothetical protein
MHGMQYAVQKQLAYLYMRCFFMPSSFFLDPLSAAVMTEALEVGMAS